MGLILDQGGFLALLDESGVGLEDEAGGALGWPDVYTYNFCNNPSFETDLTGVTAVNGATFLLDVFTGYVGAQSLQVSTPGVNPNEGVILPPGTALASGAGAVSFYLTGATPTASGTLNVFAIDTTSSTTIGSAVVSFGPTVGWQRVVINGVLLVAGHNIAVYVETASAQQTTFQIDAVQYEPSLPLNGGALPTPYIDGDQLFGTWIGTQQESASYKLYQNMIAATGPIKTSGYGSLLQQGAIFSVVNSDPANGPTQIIGGVDLSGQTFQGIDGPITGIGGVVLTTGITVLLLAAGLNDFAIFEQATDVDPAISLVGYNNAGISTGTNTAGNAGYTRPFSTFSAPVAYVQPSTGKNLWNTAAYFSVGYQLGSLAAGVSQNITHVQAETVPGTGSPVVPSAYVRPRALTATLAPSRLNYVPNPSFETSTASWAADAGTVTLSRVAGGAITGSSWSGQAVTTAANTGIYVSVPFLIVGETYTASMYVKNTTNASPNTGKLQVGTANATVSMPQNTWVRVSLTFTAVNSNILLDIQALNTGTFLVDGVMLEVGGALNAYADGGFSGWNWENPANANLTRSYYYIRGNIAYAAVQSVLSDHLPLGLSAYAPVYNSPPTQYSA